MYGIVRLLFGVIILFPAVWIIRNSRIRRKRAASIAAVILSLAIIQVSGYLPVENFFVTFDSPEKVCRYLSAKKTEVKLIVEGEVSDFTVGDDNGTVTYMIVPKVENGWKIGIGGSTKTAALNHSNGITFQVFRYKNTDDYYIWVHCLNGDPVQIKDSRDSEFYCREDGSGLPGSKYYSYYAYIPGFDGQYWVEANGERITLNGKG